MVLYSYPYIFEPQALEYPLGKQIYEYYTKENIPLIITPPITG